MRLVSKYFYSINQTYDIMGLIGEIMGLLFNVDVSEYGSEESDSNTDMGGNESNTASDYWADQSSSDSQSSLGDYGVE